MRLRSSQAAQVRGTGGRVVEIGRAAKGNESLAEANLRLARIDARARWLEAGCSAHADASGLMAIGSILEELWMSESAAVAGRPP